MYVVCRTDFDVEANAFSRRERRLSIDGEVEK